MTDSLSAQDYATTYISLGERPVPIPANEKGPKIREWTTKSFNISDFEVGGNIGLRMGPNSLGQFRFALDFDYDVEDPDRYSKSKAVLGILLGKTVLSKGRRGYTGHAISDEPIPNGEYSGLRMDLLSEGKQTVVAPSTTDGVVREWEPSIDNWTLSTVSAKGLLKVLELSDLVSKYVQEDNVRHKIALGLRAFVRERDLDVELFKKALVVALFGTNSRNIEDHLRTFDQETGTEYSTLPRELFQELDKMFRVVNRKALRTFGLGKDTKVELVETDWGNGRLSHSVRMTRWDGDQSIHIYFDKDFLPTLLLILRSLNEELTSLDNSSSS